MDGLQHQEKMGKVINYSARNYLSALETQDF